VPLPRGGFPPPDIMLAMGRTTMMDNDCSELHRSSGDGCDLCRPSCGYPRHKGRSQILPQIDTDLLDPLPGFVPIILVPAYGIGPVPAPPVSQSLV
jgi:hypothetical protein